MARSCRPRRSMRFVSIKGGFDLASAWAEREPERVLTRREFYVAAIASTTNRTMRGDDRWTSSLSSFVIKRHLTTRCQGPITAPGTYMRPTGSRTHDRANPAIEGRATRRSHISTFRGWTMPTCPDRARPGRPGRPAESTGATSACGRSRQVDAAELGGRDRAAVDAPTSTWRRLESRFASGGRPHRVKDGGAVERFTAESSPGSSAFRA